MRCNGCDEEYNEEYFPYCPYCGMPSRFEEKKENNTAISDASSSDIVNESVLNEQVEEVALNSKETENTDDSPDCVMLVNEAKQEVTEFGSEESASTDGLPTKLLISETEPILIDDAFSDNAYNRFRAFCAGNNLIYVGDLDGFDFNSILGFPGVGVKKIELYRKRYKEVLNEAKGVKPTNSPIEEEPVPETNHFFDGVSAELQGCGIDILAFADITNKTIEKLKNVGIHELKDLIGYAPNKLEKILGRLSFERLLNFEPALCGNLVDFGDYILNQQSKGEPFQIILLRAEGYTLQDIADVKDVTRERIRQIESRFLKFIEGMLWPIVEQLFDGRDYFTVQNLLDVFDNDDFDKVFFYWAKNTERLHFINYADAFVKADVNIKAVENTLLRFAEEYIGEGRDISADFEELEDAFQDMNMPYLDIDGFKAFLRENGYRCYKEFISKGRCPYGYLLTKTMAKYFPDGVDLGSSEEIARLKRYAEREFGDLNMSGNDHAVGTRIADFAVLSDRGKYTAPENVYVEQSLLDTLQDYIDNVPDQKVYFADIYERNKGIITMLSSIDNYNYLHGVLKMYMDDRYTFNDRDYLEKSHGAVYASFADRLKAFIASMGRPVSKNEIKKEFPRINDIVIVNVLTSSKGVFQWDYNYFYSLDLLKMEETDKNYIASRISAISDSFDGYCSERLLYSDVIKNNPLLLENYNINSSKVLFFVASAVLNGVFEFRRPHICSRKWSGDVLANDIALHFLPDGDVLSYKTFQSIAKKLQWTDISASIVFYDIAGSYVRLSLDEYIKKEVFSISEDVIENLKLSLRKLMSNGYLCLLNFDKWDQLPDTGYEWNIFYLRELIDRYIPEFKIIEPSTADRRYERGILVDASSSISSYEEFIAGLLIQSNQREISEKDMNNWLIMNDLAYKVIPRDLYIGSLFKFKNEKFYVLK